MAFRDQIGFPLQAMSGDSATKLPALLTPGVTNGTGTGYKQTKHDTSPPRGHSKESLPQLAPKQEADDEHGHGSIFSTGKASIDQFLLELVDPCHKGLVRFVDFAWLHVRLMYYHGRNASIQERLQSLGGTYPQQVFRRFDVDQDNHLDKVEWQEYASSLIAVLGKAYLKDACKGLLREQHEAEAKKEGPLTWRYDDQASRQLLDKVSCAMHLGRDQEDVIEGLLKKFADPNYGDRHGQTVLWHAATKCEAHCMARLLEHGGSACAAGQDLDSPVLAAARARKLQVVRLLLLNDLVETGAENEEIVSTNLIDKAAELTSKEVKDLIHRGANINYRNDRGWTPLTAAVFWNNHDYVECLVRLPHKTARSALQADLPDSRGRTALHVAARKGLSDLVPLILGARANQDARDGDGWTALHHAVFNGHTDTVLKLLDGAADPRVMDDQGFTPAMLLDSANKSNRPLGREAVKALGVSDDIKFVEKILPILKEQVLTPYQRLDKMLELPGVQGVPANLRLRDQLFNLRRGPNKVLLTKLWESLGQVLLCRLRGEKTELDDTVNKDANYYDQRAEHLRNQLNFVESWLTETTGPPRSAEWSWDNREGYREEIDSLVTSELEEFCNEANGICAELFDERSGDSLEALPEDELVMPSNLSQLTVHVPLNWMTTKDMFAAFDGLRAVKAFGERSGDEGQAIAAFMELVSTDPDFGSGENFWRSIYRLWLSSYARMLNSDFQTKVKQLVASFNDERWEEGMEVTVQGGQFKTYDAIKAAERKLGGSCTPETQAAKLLDIVECDVLANCPAAVVTLINCFKCGSVTSPTGSEGPGAAKAVPFELVRVRSNFSGSAKVGPAGLRSVTLSVIFHSNRGFAHIGHDRIIGEVQITLPQFEKLKERAGPFLRYVEREDALDARGAELLNEMPHARRSPRWSVSSAAGAGPSGA